METDIKYKPSPELKSDLLIAKRKSAKALLWIAIVSMIMFWAGLTSAYIVRQNAGNWLLFNVPEMFFVSTAVIVLSSITFYFVQNSVKKSNNKGIVLGTLLTLILGFVFMACQYKGWGELFEKGIVLGGKYSNPSGSFFLLFVLAHWAHLLGGIISLMVVLINSLRRKYNAENALGIELCAIYWHFLSILWVYLFLFLYFIR
jgi:cytochrome c oxidase subunit III